MINKTIQIFRFIAVTMFLALTLPPAKAMDVSRHATSSRLASGKWAKISVTETGIHFLSRQALASMGFSDPAKVKVFGYGATQFSDILDPDTYIDDLPQVQLLRGSGGIYFYAVGPRVQGSDNSGYMVMNINPYTTKGYYYITDTDDVTSDVAMETTATPASSSTSVTTKFTQPVHHELEAVSPGQTGNVLVGEDLKYTPTRTFNFTLVDVADGPLNLGASLFINLISSTSWSLSVQGGESKNVAASASQSGGNIHGLSSTSWLTVANTGSSQITAKITLNGGSGNCRNANLDWINLNYPRHIRIPSSNEALLFNVSGNSIRVSNTTSLTEVWDVTDPSNVKKVNHSSPDSDGSIYFSKTLTGTRTYVAFNAAGQSAIPQPVYEGRVANQNLHALTGVDMVIFTPKQWMSAAVTLANYRRQKDGLQVEVIDQEEVFNEFSSGMPHPMALRKLLKMLYDRSLTGASVPPRYVLLFGRSSYDNRQLTPSTSSFGYRPIPVWQTAAGYDDDYSYPTDDYIGLLDDGSGRTMSRDTLNVAIGRLPATSATQANIFVDKIIEYETASPLGSWRTKAIFIADDDDDGVHMTQTESMISNLESNRYGANITVEKIYIDAYEYTGGVAKGARDELYRDLDEGALWLNYIGHANASSLSGEGILNYSDVGSLYLKKLPFIYAATCDFMRWDADATSGAELLALTKGGGVIGAISSTRPVYITQNGLLSRQMGNYMMARTGDGTPLTIGEILQFAKNKLSNDDNKLRYVLLGDPSMRLLAPTASITIETVDGKPFPSPDEDPVLQARQDLTVTGSVHDPVTGELLNNFNGSVSSILYDAEESFTTLGHGTKGERLTFDRHGSRLFVGTDTVESGRFTVNIAMPAEVADNYRPAALSLYASTIDGSLSASTLEKGIYVYGIDEDAIPDDIPPVIEAMYLNHPTFEKGKTVNSSPMLIAEISDNHAINMSLAGIGHWMSLSLDEGAVTYNDVTNYYQPESIEKGTLYYQLENLVDGAHSLTLRVWDSAGNSTSATLDFYVDNSVQPKIFDIYSDRNPASETASFYLVHDRPDGDLKVEFEVYDMLGRTVWTNTSTGRADMYKSFPIVWNLTDTGGRRVERGIYIYRAVVSDLNGSKGSSSSTVTPARKIAVTSR